MSISTVQWEPSRPVPPIFPIPSVSSDFPSAMERIQAFINSFHYNYTSNPFVKPKKTGGSRHAQEVYDRLLELSLPIQCVEAVFIASILSAPFHSIQRLPISFESKCEGHIYKHIVLAVCCENRWGALGISRRDTLMFKSLSFQTLWSLIEEFESSYQAVGHTLTLVAPGMPMPHDFLTVDIPILWKALKLRLGAKQNSLSKLELEKFLRSYSLASTTIPSNHGRRRSNSHTGSASAAISSTDAIVTHEKKVSYKAAVISSTITATSNVCESDNLTIADQRSSEKLIPSSVVASKPPRAASTSRLRKPKSRAISFGTDETLKSSTIISSASQPSTARLSVEIESSCTETRPAVVAKYRMSSHRTVSPHPANDNDDDDEYQSYIPEDTPDSMILSSKSTATASSRISSSFLPPIQRSKR